MTLDDIVNALKAGYPHTFIDDCLNLSDTQLSMALDDVKANETATRMFRMQA